MAVATDTSIEQPRTAFSGEILTPQDLGYEETRRIHSDLIDKRPAMIARCLSTADVVGAVNPGPVVNERRL